MTAKSTPRCTLCDMRVFFATEKRSQIRETIVRSAGKEKTVVEMSFRSRAKMAALMAVESPPIREVEIASMEVLSSLVWIRRLKDSDDAIKKVLAEAEAECATAQDLATKCTHKAAPAAAAPAPAKPTQV